jgi:predicted nucleic acid-binding protein
VISYLDTSVVVKLYVLEPGTPEARAAVAGASVVATSRVAYAEAMAAFAGKLREREFTAKTYRQVRGDFRRDWDSYFLVEVTQQLVELAGELARRRGLRGFDALHLASAVLLRQRAKTPVCFFSADANLLKAAKLEGL